MKTHQIISFIYNEEYFKQNFSLFILEARQFWYFKLQKTYYIVVPNLPQFAEKLKSSNIMLHTPANSLVWCFTTGPAQQTQAGPDHKKKFLAQIYVLIKMKHFGWPFIVSRQVWLFQWQRCINGSLCCLYLFRIFASMAMVIL